eukprot:498865_1
MSNVFASIAEHTIRLVKHQYGHKVINLILLVGCKKITDLVKGKLRGNFVRYSMDQYACDVVQNALMHSMNELKYKRNAKNWSQIIISELLQVSNVNVLKNPRSTNIIENAFETVIDQYQYSPELFELFRTRLGLVLIQSDVEISAHWLTLIKSAIKLQE